MKVKHNTLLAAALVLAAFTGSASAAVIDPLLLNNTDNSGVFPDEGPGVVVTPADNTGLAGDDLRDVFGNGDGDVEGNSFIFTTTGTNFFQFNTTVPVALEGIAINTAGDGGTDGGTRSTSLFTFFADTDNNGLFDEPALVSADPTDDLIFDEYLFAGGEITASFFRVEITSTNGAAGQEARVLELDAIVVPEPSSLGLVGLGALGLMARRRR